MKARRVEEKVMVITPSRLHFGILEPSKKRGFCGGAGVALEKPRFVIEADAKGKVDCRERIPSHVGLGSTTQKNLALSSAYRKLGLARKEKKAWDERISRIGAFAFEKGGFIADFGNRIERRNFPSSWAFVLAMPKNLAGVSGEGERGRFARLVPNKRITHMMRETLGNDMLGALSEKDIRMFGNALTKYNHLAGMLFLPAGQSANERKESPTQLLIGEMLELGAEGAGQSSWGPLTFSLVLRKDAMRVAARIKKFCKERKMNADVFVASARNKGATVSVMRGRTSPSRARRA